MKSSAFCEHQSCKAPRYGQEMITRSTSRRSQKSTASLEDIGVGVNVVGIKVEIDDGDDGFQGKTHLTNMGSVILIEGNIFVCD